MPVAARLAGAELARLNVAAIDGIDISREMLAVAEAKGIYQTLDEADLTGPLTIPDNAYDGVICVGVFTNGHVGPATIGELARTAKNEFKRLTDAEVAAIEKIVADEFEGYPSEVHCSGNERDKGPVRVCKSLISA